MTADTYQELRKLLDDYLQMYASRDDRLTTLFSEDFSGFTGGGDFLVKNKEPWVEITRLDFSQVKDPLRLELKDVSIQSLAETIAVATSFFTIHLPVKDSVLSRETARLVLIFRKESAGWKISHSSISIPYQGVGEGEVYPLKDLADRNQTLEKVIAERTEELSTAKERLQQAYDALHRSEELYRSILNASPDDITISDKNGRIIMVSPVGKTMFGYKEDGDFMGRLLTDFIIPEDRERALAQVAKKHQGLLTTPSEYRAQRSDGTTFEIEVNSELIRTADGLPAGMVVIARDITERKQAAAEKAKLEAQNRQLQKSESLGRMAGAIAHHFNNQLQGVMLNLGLAVSNLHGNEGPIGSLSEAMQSASKAAEVSTLMLTYLGQAQVKNAPLDLAEVCKHSLALLKSSLPRGLRLEAHLPSPGPVINANADQLRQVLSNLLNNASEACREGPGSVCLSVKTLAVDAIPGTRFPLNWRPQDKASAFACLELSDTGCGIEPKDFEQLFDPFFSTKFTGRGLGLPVVLGIARSLDGVITVESKPGQGSVFRVILPLSVETLPHKPRQGQLSPITPYVRQGGVVLVVDDDPVVRKTQSLVIKRSGLTVLEAEDGIAAVEVFGQNSDKISCVVCDLTMPRMNGWDTLAALRKLAPGLPVILTSGYSEGHVMQEEHTEQPQAFLHKPYDARTLVNTIKQILSRSDP